MSTNLLAPSLHAALTKAVTQQEVKRLLAGAPGDRDLLGLVAAAGGGLTARDLGELTGQQAWQVEDSLRATAGRTFVTRAGIWLDQETYVLGHEELQEDAVSLLGGEALGTYRQRLHEWALRAVRSLPSLRGERSCKSACDDQREHNEWASHQLPPAA